MTDKEISKVLRQDAIEACVVLAMALSGSCVAIYVAYLLGRI
jgi:hypothetical protein